MLNHEKKLCYVVYPKSGSSSFRDFLRTKQGFLSPIGRWEHADVKQIIKHTKAQGYDITNYTFFSTYRESIPHFISGYKHIQDHPKWNGKIYGRNIIIKCPEDYLNYLENLEYKWDQYKPYVFCHYKDYFSDKDGDNKVTLMLDLSEQTIKKFCSEFGIKYSPLSWSNKSKPNKIILNNNQKERIKKLYKANEDFIKKYNYNKS